MGAELVRRAITFGTITHLTGNEFSVLVQMAVIALDSDQVPRYAGGRDELARSLGRILPSAPNADDPEFERISSEREAGLQAVKEAVKGLRKKGAIRRAPGAMVTERAVYEVTLNGESSPAAVYVYRTSPDTWIERTQAETLERAQRHYTHWAGWELELVSDYSRTAKSLALQLGRTLASVRSARRGILNDPQTIQRAGLSKSGIL